MTDQLACPLADPSNVRAYLLYIAEQHFDRDLGARGGASDLVQVALLRTHEAQAQYRGTTPHQYRGWLRSILLSVIHKFRRHHRCRPAEPAPEAIAAVGTHVPPSGPARQTEEREELARALAALPEEMRQVIVLRIDHELPFADIGERIGKSADAVRMTYHRGLERLRSLLPAA